MVYKTKPTKDGRCWQFRAWKKDKYGINRQVRSIRYNTKHEAEEAERIFLLEKANPNRVKFDTIARDYFNDLENYNRSSTYQSYWYDYNSNIKPFFENMYITNINMKDIKNWHEYMDSKGHSTSYKNKSNSLLSSIFKYAIKFGKITSNPVLAYGRFKEPDKIKEESIKYITFDEFQKFISVIDEQLWYCFFNTLYYTGCRKGEIFALQWKDLDFNTNTLSITKTVARSLENDVTINPTKTNINRKVKLNKTLIDLLKDWEANQMKIEDFEESWYIFGGYFPIARTTVDRYKHKYFELSGVHEITIHQFRHSAVTLLVNKMLEQDSTLDINKALITLSTRFGHSPEVMMRTYAHLYVEKLQEPIIDILDKL